MSFLTQCSIGYSGSFPPLPDGCSQNFKAIVNQLLQVDPYARPRMKEVLKQVGKYIFHTFRNEVITMQLHVHAYKTVKERSVARLKEYKCL